MGKAFPEFTWDYLCRIILCTGLTSENEEWSNSSELSAVFQSSQGHWCRGLFYPDLGGQIIQMSPIPLKEYAGGWVQDTPVIMKSQHLEMAESLNSSILHLPGDNEAHRYMLVERTTEVHPNWWREDKGMWRACLKQQHCFWGLGK